MKPIITREGVADAIKKLNEAGQKATLSAIHAALGGKGSLSTLIKFKAELEQQATTPQDSAEGLTQFRALWAAAVGEGRKQLETQIGEIRAGLDALTAENERLEAAAIADANRLDEIQGQRDKLIDELSQANKAATEARAAGEQHAVKLAHALEQIQTTQRHSMEEYKSLQAQITAWKEKAHALEVERATLTEQKKSAEKEAADGWAAAARLEAQNKELLNAALERDRLAIERDRLTHELKAAKEEIAHLNKAKKPTTPKA